MFMISRSSILQKSKALTNYKFVADYGLHSALERRICFDIEALRLAGHPSSIYRKIFIVSERNGQLTGRTVCGSLSVDVMT